MRNITANKSAKVSVSAPEGVSGVSATYEVFDEEGSPVGSGAIAEYDGNAATITVSLSSADNALAQGVSHSGRELVVTITDDEGDEHEARDYFVLVASNPLTVLGNSFLSFPAALALREQFGPVMDGWDKVQNNSTRQSALIQAHSNLCRVRYAVGAPKTGDVRDYAAYGTGSEISFDFKRRVSLMGISREDFDALPDHFRKALRRAQLIEANILLGGDIVGQKRKDGIISETIGESSTFFSSKPYLNLPFSRQAFEVLKPYITVSVRVGR